MNNLPPENGYLKAFCKGLWFLKRQESLPMPTHSSFIFKPQLICSLATVGADETPYTHTYAHVHPFHKPLLLSCQVSFQKYPCSNESISDLPEKSLLSPSSDHLMESYYPYIPSMRSFWPHGDQLLSSGNPQT